MKKGLRLSLFCLSIFGLGAVGVAVANPAPVAVLAEGDEPAPVANTVVVDAVDHAKITTSIQEGAVGDICVVNVKSDLFYIVNSITVNGTALIESEITYGEYSFALVEGENRIAVSMKIDEDAVGVFYDSMKAIENKDWAYLFSVKNILAILGSLLSGGCLIAMIRYVIKDKKIADRVEKGAKEAVEKLVPAQTKEAVLKAVEGVVTPIFAQLQADNAQMRNAMGVFARCLALSQENTPEARMAIINELSQLKLGDDSNVYASIMAYIDKVFKEHEETFNQAIASLQEISEKNEEILNEDNDADADIPVEEAEKVPVEEDDGTQI